MVQDDIKKLKSYFLSKDGGALNGSVIPATDKGFLLGSAAKRWLVNHNVGAKVYNSAAIALTTGVLTVLTYNSESYDFDAIHSTSSNTDRLTCTVAGIYVIGSSIEFAAHATGMRSIALRVNGATTYLGGQTVPAVAATNNQALNISVIHRLAVGDYVQSTAFQTSGGNLNVIANAYSPYFWMQLLSIDY